MGASSFQVFPLSVLHPSTIEYLREYFADRKDLEAFEQHVNEQMAAYEETERKVRVPASRALSLWRIRGKTRGFLARAHQTMRDSSWW